MNILIVFAHPSNKNGFSFKILEKTVSFLREKNIDFDILDLYKMNYDPILKETELFTAGNREISTENLLIQEKIKNSKGLIFIYPIWWGGMPAILKGFFDRVFTPGFAYRYGRRKFLKFLPERLLSDKKAIVFTSLGSPGFVYWLLLNPIKIINKFIIFSLFVKKSKTFCIFKTSQSTLEKRNKEIERMVSHGINWLLN